MFNLSAFKRRRLWTACSPLTCNGGPDDGRAGRSIYLPYVTDPYIIRESLIYWGPYILSMLWCGWVLPYWSFYYQELEIFVCSALYCELRHSNFQGLQTVYWDYFHYSCPLVKPIRELSVAFSIPVSHKGCLFDFRGQNTIYLESIIVLYNQDLYNDVSQVSWGKCSDHPNPFGRQKLLFCAHWFLVPEKTSTNRIQISWVVNKLKRVPVCFQVIKVLLIN